MHCLIEDQRQDSSLSDHCKKKHIEVGIGTSYKQNINRINGLNNFKGMVGAELIILKFPS